MLELTKNLKSEYFYFSIIVLITDAYVVFDYTLTKK